MQSPFDAITAKLRQHEPLSDSEINAMLKYLEAARKKLDQCSSLLHDADSDINRVTGGIRYYKGDR